MEAQGEEDHLALGEEVEGDEGEEGEHRSSWTGPIYARLEVWRSELLWYFIDSKVTKVSSGHLAQMWGSNLIANKQ